MIYWQTRKEFEIWSRRTPTAERYGGDACTFARKELGFEPDAKQAEILSGEMHRVVLCCSRQWGKSTVAAIVATHHLVHHAGAFVAVMCPAEKQAAELLRKVKGFLEEMGMATKTDGIHRHSVQLPGGSRMIALTCRQGTNRGLSKVTLLIVDEAAQVPDWVYDAIRPSLAVGGGALWLISTPYGKRGFFWGAWEDESGRWRRFLVTAKDCPRLSEEFLREEMETRGARRYRQEYECEFQDDGASIFDVNLLLTAVTDEFAPLRV